MITLDSNPIPQQPSELNENPEQIKTDTHAIDGTRQRNQHPSKKRSVFRIRNAKPATYQFIKALYDAAAPVDYVNDESNVSGGTLEFTGIIDFNEDDFIRGGSLMVPLTVTIREV
jgi:hypothetical protein